MSHSGNYESFVKHRLSSPFTLPQGATGGGTGGGFTIPGKRTGAINVAATAAAALSGCLVGMAIDNMAAHPPVPVVLGSDIYMNFTANASDPLGHIAGYSSPGAFSTSRNKSPLFQIRCKAFSTTVANAKLYIGFSSTNATTLALSDTPLANADSGILLGFNAGPNFCVFSNDGTGPMTTTSMGIPKDALFHIYSIQMTPSSVVCQLDALAPVTLTTGIPSLSTNLNLFLNFEQS